MTGIFSAALAAALLAGASADDGKTWSAKAVPHEAGALYALSYRAVPGGAGVLTGGPRGYNMDFTVKTPEKGARLCTYIYPAEAAAVDVRLGTWEMPSGATWRDVSVCRVEPAYKTLPGGIELGAGEAVDGNVYRFYRREFNVQGAHVRPLLKRSGAVFNSNRWCHYGTSGVDYLFELKGRRFLSCEIALPVVHFTKGAAVLSVSNDGRTWHDVAICDRREIFTARAPAGLFPADRLYVRTRGTAGTSLQTAFPRLTARIDGAPLRAAGFTRYVDAATGAAVGEVPAPAYYDETWGQTIDVPAKGFTLWRADEERRVAPWRAAPSRRARGLAVAAAANEAEAVQLVVKAHGRDVRGVTVRLEGDLTARGGGRLPAAAVDVRQVTFLDIRDLSDATSAPGLWPEVLEPVPPEGLEVPAGENRAFWVRVTVPKGTPAGRYVGRLLVETSAGAASAAVPFGVEVFGFELPDRMTLQTSFGYTPNRVYAYHGAADAADRRTVNAHYLRALSQAHLSPYNPGSGFLPPWKYTVAAKPGDEAHAVVAFDWAAWDAGMKEVLETYRFNTFIFRIPGFSHRHFRPGVPHVFHGRTEGTPGYDALVAKYLGGIEAHLREKGWIDTAYLYWYDEPTDDKLAELDRGLRLVKKYAPSLRRMITKEPCPGLFEGVNLWCPTPDKLETAETARCRARGDQFWWYVCMQPKAPYATLFIDHPGTDLRVWLWQTWQRRVTGILIWETVYWSSPTVYRNELQNPYDDAASWSDMGQGPKTFRYNWGNGDGRFLYPPRRCFMAERDGPVLEPPNGTMRLEILRDGIEDYEYFARLARLAPGHPLLRVPDDVSASLTAFTTRPEPLKAHRRRLAKEIERLEAEKK